MAAGTGSAPSPSRGRRLALVVAVTDYVDASLRRLRAPATDAAELRDLLADPEVGGFSVTSVVNERAHQTRLAIEEFLSDRLPDDVLLLYLSCHGLVDARRRLYFAARDTLKTRLASSGVEAHWVLDQLEECRARRQVVILDCCFSGAFSRGAKGDDDLDLGARLLGEGRGRVVLTASRGTEYSFEGEPLEGEDAPRGSVFTSALVEGIRTGAADADGDGHISVEDAYSYAFERVRSAGHAQTPQRWLYGAEGSILLARTPRPADVPPPPPSAAPQGPPNDQPVTRRRAALVAAGGAGVAAVVAAVALLWPQEPADRDPAGGGTAAGSFSREAPWQLLIVNTTEDGEEVDRGCDVTLVHESTGKEIPWTDLYGRATFQMQLSGTFRWEVSDQGCQLAPQTADPVARLPIKVTYDQGDSQRFDSPGLISVTVTDWTGSSDCELRLLAGDDGRLLDSVEAVEGEEPFTLDGRDVGAVYLGDPGCTVRLARADR